MALWTNPPPNPSSSAPAPPRLPRNAGPVLRVTAYDRVSSLLMAMIAAVTLAAVMAIGWWLTTRPPPPPEQLVPLEIVDVDGGYEDGSPDETLRVESPEPERSNASLVEAATADDTPAVASTIANVMTASGRASQMGMAVSDEPVETNDIESTGVPGSARGTGGRPLGLGGGTTGGVPRELRWFVKFSDGVSVEEYARQLDFFEIELGVLSADGTLTYVSKLSSPRPATRKVQSGKDEKRLYFRWQGGERKGADETLLKKAGITDRGTIFHFYSPKTENLLATLEARFTSRKLREVRRTYFNVIRTAKDYTFVVARQTYLR